MKFRVTYYEIDNMDHRWTEDFESSGRTAATRHVNRRAGEKGWGIRNNPEPLVIGDHVLPTLN